MYTEDEYLLLSGIQHFSFCRRQWALIHIEDLWSENALTAEGRVVHERVHDRSAAEKRGEELTVRGMPVKSALLGVSGECDAVVFTQSDEGVSLHGRRGLWKILPVEYKHGRSKANDCDRLQAAAQAMCLEEMFCCRIERAALFYHETRTREYIELSEDLRREVCRMFSEMHDLYRRGHTPKVKTSEKCGRCSLSDLCLPKLLRKSGTVSDYIDAHMREDQEP